MEPERCIDCGMLLKDVEIFCTEDESQCRCADCDRDYWNERELLEDNNPSDSAMMQEHEAYRASGGELEFVGWLLDEFVPAKHGGKREGAGRKPALEHK